MALSLGRYLVSRGIPLAGLWGRDAQATAQGAEWIGTHAFGNLDDLVRESDLILLAVSDDAIETVASRLAACGPMSKWIGHLSGCKDRESLRSLEAGGNRLFSLHPLQTVADPDQGCRALKDAVLVLEVAPEDRPTLRAWMAPLGNPIAEVEPGMKSLYHLGACLASNYVMVLLGLAEEALRTAGIDETVARKGLTALASGTLENYCSMGAVEGLTGPVSRGDVGTVAAHFKALDGPWADRKELVRLLGLQAARVADRREHGNQEGLKRMISYLNGGI